MDLLILNAIKGLKKKKIQMLGIVVMVLLSTGIYTTMNSAVDRLEDRYYHYLDHNKVEHISLEPTIDYTKDITPSLFLNLRDTKLKEVTEEEGNLLDLYQMCLIQPNEACNQEVYAALEQVFKKYDVYEELGNEKLDVLAKKYDFTYELQKTKVVTDQNYTTNVMPYEEHKKMNLPHLVEGKFPTKAGEITVLPKFASKNGLEIGDNYKINGKQYKIVGFAYVSDYIYPMLSMNQPIFDEKYNNIVFMLPSDYELFDGIKNDTYGILLNGNYGRKNRIANELTRYLEEEDKQEKTLSDEEIKSVVKKAQDTGDSMLLITTMLEYEKEEIHVGMNTMIRLLRTDAIQMEFKGSRTFAETFLYLLLTISVFIILVITKKRIDDERLQIGVLKSLGYKRYQIAASYLVYPILGSIVGGLLGYALGVLLHEPLTELFLSFYTVPLAGFHLNSKYFINSLMIPLILLSTLSFIIAYFMLRKKPLALLKEGSNLKINLLSKVVTHLTKPLSFESKFRYKLASRSVGKLLIVTLTSFCTGLLIVLILIGSNLFEQLIDQSFENLDYKYMVSYKTIQYSDTTEDDLILSSTMDIKKVLDSHGKEKKLEDDEYSINLTGIDSYTKYIEVKDEKEKNLIPLLYEEDRSIIINKNIAEYMKIKVGDTVVLDNNGTEVSFKIAAIQDDYLGSTSYISRELLSKTLGYEGNAYSMKYTVNEDYSNIKSLDSEEVDSIASVFSIDDLRRNIETQMGRMDAVIYIVIFFASFMVLIIISVIANIVVEENKKTISLMKVMGYQNKEISSIVLNIYTPFIIVAYLLSIPCMIALLKWIITLLIGDTKMVIPITLSPTMAALGLLGLLIAYYIAITLSRRVLNKVPLAVALKRE